MIAIQRRQLAEFGMKCFTQLFLMLVAALCLFPLLWMLGISLKSSSEVYVNMSLFPRHPVWLNYLKAWREAEFGLYFSNSLFYTITVLLGVLLISSLTAYGLAWLEIPGKNFFYYLFVGTLMIPIPGAFIPLYVLLVKLHLANTRLGYILPLINSGLAVAIFILKSFFEEIPREVMDAGRIDGCSKFDIYWRIVLPISRPALATIAIFTGLSVWNEYLLALVIFASKHLMPVQLGLTVFQGQYITRYEMLMAATTIATIPVVLLYIAMQKHIIKGIMAGAVKG